jgi:molybdate transport repressor ModE-like protein
MTTPFPQSGREGLDDAATPQGKLLFSRLVNHVRLRQLQLLVALQQCGSVVQAAASLHMSQSAATQALAEMERVLDIALFERHARGVRPTLAGQTLVDTVRGVLAALEEVADSLAAIRRGAAAALRLGAIPAAALAIVSRLLARFYAEHPEVHVDVHEDGSTRLLSQLLGGGLDAVFCRQPALLPGPYVFEPLLDDQAVVVAARSHALAGRRGVSLASLAGARWVLPTANIAVRDILEREVLQVLPGASWFPVSTVSLPVLEGLLSQPGAVALVPRSIVPGLQGHARVCRLDVRLSGALAPLGVVYRRDQAPALLAAMLALWPGLESGPATGTAD